MLQLLKFLILGKQCQHDWKLMQSMEPFNNHCQYLYCCTKCGKIIKRELRIKYWGE